MAYISTMPKQSAIATVEIANLVQQVREIILSARARAAQSVDAIQIAMNFASGSALSSMSREATSGLPTANEW